MMMNSMHKRNILISILLIAGIMMFAVIQGVLLPAKEQRQQAYAKAQLEPSTHDFTQLLPYKSKYMGDAPNLINLFYHLPMGQYGVRFQLYSSTLKAQLNYQTDVQTIGQEQAETAMIYNATAAFALIDNLKTIEYTFPSHNTAANPSALAIKTKYEITRKDIETWYGMPTSQLANPQTWKKKVQQQLTDQTYIKKAAGTLLHEIK